MWQTGTIPLLCRECLKQIVDEFPAYRARLSGLTLNSFLAWLVCIAKSTVLMMASYQYYIYALPKFEGYILISTVSVSN